MDELLRRPRSVVRKGVSSRLAQRGPVVASALVTVLGLLAPLPAIAADTLPQGVGATKVVIKGRPKPLVEVLLPRTGDPASFGPMLVIVALGIAAIAWALRLRGSRGQHRAHGRAARRPSLATAVAVAASVAAVLLTAGTVIAATINSVPLAGDLKGSVPETITFQADENNRLTLVDADAEFVNGEQFHARFSNMRIVAQNGWSVSADGAADHSFALTLSTTDEQGESHELAAHDLLAGAALAEAEHAKDWELDPGASVAVSLSGAGTGEPFEDDTVVAIIETTGEPMVWEGLTATIEGTPKQGETLKAVPANAPEDGTNSFGYQWQSSGDNGASWSDVSGATEETLTIGPSATGAAAPDLVGKALRVVVSCENPAWYRITPAQSAATAEVEAIEYVISYELNDDDAPSENDQARFVAGVSNPESYNVRSATIILANPTRGTNYDFLGWTGENLTEPSTSVTIPTGSMGHRSYTAHWKAKSYTITFVPNAVGAKGGMNDMRIEYGDRSQSLTRYDASRLSYPGYTWQSWNEDSAGGSTSWEDGKAIGLLGRDVTLYAQWKANTNTPYKVLHYQQHPVGDGYTLMDMDTDNLTGTTDQDTAATPKSYEGFRLSESHHAGGVIEQKKIAGDGSTIVEIYYDRKVHNVSFVSKPGSGSPIKVAPVDASDPDPTTLRQRFGTVFDAPTLTPPNRYWSVAGWYEADKYPAKGLTEKTVNAWEFDTMTMPDRDVTLYAYWVPGPNVPYRVIHRTQDVDADNNVALSTYTEYAREDLTASFAEDEVTPNVMSILGFDAPSKQTVKVMTSDPDNPTTVTYDYARRSYKVTFHANNGPSAESKTQTFVYQGNAKLTALSELGYTREGYKFGAWYPNAGGTGTTSYDDAERFTMADPADVDLFVHWEPLTFDVIYDRNGGDSEPAEMAHTSITYGEPATALATNGYTRKGYTFKSWNTKPDGSGETKTEAANLLKNLTLYAQWTANPYLVTFKSGAEATATGKTADGKTPATGTMNPQTLVYDADETELSANSFERTGYTFKKWTAEIDGEARTFSDGQKVRNLTAKKGGEVILTAAWQANSYGLTFMPNVDEAAVAAGTVTGVSGSTAAMLDCEYDKTYTLTKCGFMRDGYDFLGWSKQASAEEAEFVDEREVSNLTAVNGGEPVKLWAIWEARHYNVTFDANDDASDSSKTHATVHGSMTNLTNVEYDKTTEFGFTLERTGYTLLRWDCVNTAGETIETVPADATSFKNLTTMDGATVTLRAVWKEHTYTITFDSNPGTASTASEVTTLEAVTLNYDDPYTLGEVSLKGYTFQGWNTKADGTGDTHNVGTEVRRLTAEDKATTTLYARWKANTYSIVYHANREGVTGSMNDTVQTFDSLPFRLSASGFSIEYRVDFNYNADNRTYVPFTGTNAGVDGWATTASGSKVYGDRERITNNLAYDQGAKVDLWAVWTGVDAITLPGLPGGDIELYKDDASTFKGWCTDPDHPTTSYKGDPGTSFVPTGSIVLYGVWE